MKNYAIESENGVKKQLKRNFIGKTISTRKRMKWMESSEFAPINVITEQSDG